MENSDSLTTDIQAMMEKGNLERVIAQAEQRKLGRTSQTAQAFQKIRQAEKEAALVVGSEAWYRARSDEKPAEVDASEIEFKAHEENLEETKSELTQ